MVMTVSPGMTLSRSILALALFTVNCLAAPAIAAESPLEPFFRRYLDERFALHPTEATALGDHRFDDRMDDLSPAALEKSLAHLKQSRARLRKEIDRYVFPPLLGQFEVLPAALGERVVVYGALAVAAAVGE